MKHSNIITVIFVFLYACFPLGLFGQDIVNLRHVVLRGETFDIMAKKYGTTTEMLKAANLDMETFYTGMEILVPVDKKYMCLRSEEDGEEILKDIAGYLAECNEATRIFNIGDYKESGKLYALTIQNYGKYFPCVDAYFGKALCDYNREKWGSAIDGFAQVIRNDECSENLRERSRELKVKAEEKYEESRQQKAELIGGILQTVAAAGAAYLEASQNKAGQNSNSTTMSQGTKSSLDSGHGVEDGNRASSNTSNSNALPSKICKKLSATDHAHCNGNGICSRCNGERVYLDNSFGLDKWVSCTTCRGTGKCSGCNGTGRIL